MTETVVVTGALGDAGSWLTDSLRTDYDVIAIDRTRPENQDIDGVDFRAVDLTDQGTTWETIVDADPAAVVHYGNIPHEADHAGGEVFENNAVSTFHTLEAAGRADADVVWASSETVYGTHWPEPQLPRYLPVDEDHPVAPWNGYETSKLAGEAAADRITNAFDVSVATIRPSWIQFPGEYVVTSFREEFSFETAERFGNLWSYVDIRDVVSLTEAALAAVRDGPIDGHEVLNCFAAENFLGVDTADAIKAGYGDLPDRCGLAGEESGFSTAKAGELLDWEPSHSWKSAENETVEGPAFV